jgi:uncharacterized phage protein gp47/JayE
MFRTKSFLEIIGSMMGQARATQRTISDWNKGSVARTLLEAPANEIDQLYQEMAQGLVEAIPVAIYRSFEFDLRDAQYSAGLLRFTARPGHNQPITIPVGFLVSTTTGQRYQTAEAGTMQVGQDSIDLLAVAIETGTAGNASAGTITRLVGSGLGLVGVTNPQAFSNGRSQETPAERKLRFVEFVRALARGTPASLRYIAKQAAMVDATTGVAIERVARVEVEETTGHTTLYIHNGTGATSAELVAQVLRLTEGYYDADGLPVPGYAPTGMRVDVLAMAETPVSVRLAAQVPLVLRSETLRAQIVEAIRATILATPNRGRLTPLSLINAAVALDAVGGAEIEAPTVIVPCPVSTVLVPGDIVVTWF